MGGEVCLGATSGAVFALTFLGKETANKTRQAFLMVLPPFDQVRRQKRVDTFEPFGDWTMA